MKKKTITKSLKERFIRMVLIVQTILMYQIPVYATTTNTTGGLVKSKLYTGTLQLLTDLRIIFLAVEVSLTIFLEIKEGMAWQASEEQEKAMHKKKMISIGALAILIVSITALVPVIMAYYQ